MINDEVVIVNYAKEELLTTYKCDNYKFEDTRLARFLKWICKKTRVINNVYMDKITYRTKVIFKENIRKQIYEVLNELKIKREEIDYFIVGRKQAELLEDEFYKGVYTDNFTCYEPLKTIYGIRVEINPYIDGIVPVLKK